MKNKEFDKLWKKYSEAKTEEDQYGIMKEFMFSSSLEDLLAWNHYLGDKGHKMWAEYRKTGLTEEDKAFYKAQFEQFDALVSKLKLGQAA